MDREPQAISLEIGTEDEWLVQLAGEDNVTLDPYQPGDPIAVDVGQGPALPVLFSLEGTWIDPAAGSILVPILTTDTAGQLAGTYPIDLYVTRVADGKRRKGWSGWLELTTAPEPAALIPPTYCSAQDMMDVAGDWLYAIRQSYTAANYLRARVRARKWIEKAVLAHIPASFGRGDLSFGLALYGPMDAYSAQVQSYFDAGQLIVTDALVELCAHKALAILCQDQAGSSDPDPWPARATFYHRQANRLARNYVAEIDTTGDGTADFAFSLGRFSLRRD